MRHTCTLDITTSLWTRVRGLTYIDSSLNITEEVKEQLRHDNGQWEINAFLDRRCVNKRKHKWELLVQWTGYEGGGEDTWEPVLQLYQDVPTLVKRYLPP